MGSIYALVAIGYNVIYRTTTVFNFAQGAIVATGSLLAYTAVSTWRIGAGLAILVCVAGGALVAVAQDVLTVRPILRRAPSSEVWLVGTLGVSVVVTASAELVWGSDPRQLDVGWLNHLVNVG